MFQWSTVWYFLFNDPNHLLPLRRLDHTVDLCRRPEHRSHSRTISRLNAHVAFSLPNPACARLRLVLPR